MRAVVKDTRMLCGVCRVRVEEDDKGNPATESDLLAVCREYESLLVALVTSQRASGSNPDGLAINEERLRATRAAISKATGG